MNGDNKAKTPNTPKVEISVRNFGPIAEADLDLRPLTVFVGPSNTGKTYLSVLIYALHQVFCGFSGFPLIDYVTASFTNHLWRPSLSMNPDALIVEIQEILKNLNTEGQKFKFSDLSEKDRDLAQRILKHPDFCNMELKRCFDLDTLSELIQLTSGKRNEMGISLKVSEENQNLWSFDMRASKSEIAVDGQINGEMTLIPEDGERLKGTLRLGGTFEPFTWSSKLVRRRHYLPAARSGIMQSHRVIASSLVARSARAGLEALEIPTLSGVVADFMEDLILYEERARFRERTRPNEGINHFADALESDVLDGQIITKPSPTGYPEFLYRPQGIEQDMRLNRSSSMVSELAPLVLYLRSLVRPGDTLIIEEPEAHLHPAAQAQMAATLARLVRAGVRVLVTTHSDFMLQEIGNLMRVGMLKEKDALKKETNDWLSPEEVGAWHFQKDHPVKEIQFDHTVGIEPEDYEDVAESLYNRWAGLQNRIEELKDESERECE